MKKKIISMVTGIAMMSSLYVPSVGAAQDDCFVTLSYTQNGNGYSACGTYNYGSDVDGEITAMLAVYDADGRLRNVTSEDVTVQDGGNLEINGVAVNEGDTVKGMLWEKNTKIPLADCISKVITEIEATATPTAIPTATPTPTVTSTPEVSQSDLHWDFAEYADNAITASGETDTDYDGMEIHLANGDTITTGGLVWKAPGGIASNSTTTVTNNRYIKYTPQTDGILTVTFSGSIWNSTSKAPRMYVSCGDSLACTTKDANSSQLEPNQTATAKAANTDTALSAELTAGNTYYIWPYYYNSTACAFTVSDMKFEKIEAEMTTRNIYGSNMLLQRDKPVYIDGKCSKAVTNASVSLINESTNETVQTKSVNIEDKEWNVTLDAVSDYENTYSIVMSADGMDDVVYENVIFGDLYLFSGQSNMWKQVSYYRNIDKDAYGTDVIAANATDKIRVMHTKGSGDYGTAVLQYDALNAQPWRDFSTYDNVSDISAPAYTAAVKMHNETGVPIGLITNAYPGSYISSWFDSALAIDACNLGRNKNANERNWYCGRIYPLRNLELSGIFWYQGCADAATTYHDNPYEYYSEMMPKLINTYRELFGNDKLPFYYVQLSRIGSTIVDENNPDTGAAGKMPIKRAQIDTYLDMNDKTNVGVIGTLDLYGNYNANGTANCRTDIHLGQKQIIGERMAAYALADIYGKEVYSHGPMYKSSEVRDGKVIVTFDVNGSLAIMDSAQYADSTGVQKIADGEFDPTVLNEFELAGADGVWHSAAAQITAANQVTVYSENVSEPVKVRYCGKDYPESPNLTDSSNLPSYVFERAVETKQSPTDEPTDEPTTEPTLEPTDDANIAETYKFDFGSGTPAEGYYSVTTDMVYDVSDTSDKFQYGFLGTTPTSYADDLLTYDCDSRAIDGFSLVKGQQIILTSGGEPSKTDADSDFIAVPKQENYLAANASVYEGRYPIRFSMKSERKSYYTVTATLTSSSDTENACASLFTEKRQIVAEDVTIAPGEKITFKFNVDVEDVTYKEYGTFKDDMLNICVAGENAAISSLIVEKHAKVEGTIKGNPASNGVNDGVTMWLCTDSTGCDCAATVPFFALQNYAGVGQALVKYAPENIAISNQGERGLATGDNGHFNLCYLKEGDYLYVEYGHNESGAESYKTNLEKYYTRAHNSGAKLIVVSAINRHNHQTDGIWTSDFTGYINAATEFVNEKIEAGADDIAFVDLNTLYVDWMNEETARIRTINPSLSVAETMNFYYRSVKGSSVDGTHMNDAGADRGAYCFFEAARNVVDAASLDTADDSLKIQAEVLRPLVEGMKTKVGDSDIPNLPMTVSDEIIMAGAAPNIYWDTVPSDLFEYDNSVAIDKVNAITSDDTVEIFGVDIRIMNKVDEYLKAVVTVTDGDDVKTYYTENNYDCTGDEPGTVKSNSGFITVDKDHSQVTDADKIESITVPADAECTIQLVACDDNWIVGDKPTVYSVLYNVYPEFETVFEDDCSSAEGWNVLTGVATHSETVVTDDENGTYMSIYSSGVNSSGTKKNYGIYKTLTNEMTSGKYRLTFKTCFGSGVARFVLASAVGNASSPFTYKVYPIVIDTNKVYMNSESNTIYTITDDDNKKSGKINANTWINAEVIIDIDNAKLYVSVAGSDYSEFDISDWSTNNSALLPIKYFGIAGANDGTPTTVDIDDIKLVGISDKTALRTISVSVNDNSFGNVTINGENISETEVGIASTVVLKATAYDGYQFVNWTDENGNVVSETAQYSISRVYSNAVLTANFEEMAEGSKMWSFSGFADENEVSATAEETVDYDGMEIHINSGDSVSDGGIFWSTAGGKASDSTTTVTNNRYIKYTPETDGELTLTFSGSAWNTSSKAPRIYISCGDSLACTTKNANSSQIEPNQSATATAANQATVCTAKLTAGNTYYIWPYYYNNLNVSFKVTDISFKAE